jgi:hypothetical protein
VVEYVNGGGRYAARQVLSLARNGLLVRAERGFLLDDGQFGSNRDLWVCNPRPLESEPIVLRGSSLGFFDRVFEAVGSNLLFSMWATSMSATFAKLRQKQSTSASSSSTALRNLPLGFKDLLIADGDFHRNSSSNSEASMQTASARFLGS